MNQCVNLRNLLSRENTYTNEDIAPLHNLKRLFSYDDIYQSENSCMLSDLFLSNKMEYVFIYNKKPNSNVVGPVTLQHNISSLRHFYIEQYGATYEIKLDVSIQVPESLAVYYVVTWNDGPLLYGTIEGPPGTVARLEERLVHELPKNN